MRKHHLLLTLCCILLSCSSGNTNKKIKEISQDSILTLHFPIIDFQKECPEKNIVLQEIADVTYIPLETNDSVLLSHRPFIHMTDSYLVTHNEKTVCFFKKDGKYSHSFNHIGESGMEYVIIKGLCVDEKAKEVFIYDLPTLYRILVYDLQGSYKRTISLTKTRPHKFFSRSIYDFDDDYFFAEDHYDVDVVGEKKINPTPYYKISKKDGSLISLPFSVKNRIRDGMMFDDGVNFISTPLFISPIAKMGSDMIIADYALDTVYNFQDSIFKPIAVRLNHYEGDIPILATVDIMSDRYLFWYTVKKDIDLKNNHIPDPVTYLFDKHTGECFKAGITNKDGVSSDDYATKLQFKYRLSGNLHVLPKNCAMQAYPADFLIEQYQAGKLSGKLKEIASKLKEEDNPVLILAKFKE